MFRKRNLFLARLHLCKPTDTWGSRVRMAQAWGKSLGHCLRLPRS